MVLFKADYKNKTDSFLVKRILKKDQYAFEELYLRYNARMYRYFLRLCANNAQAEDLLQDLFLRLINKADLFDHNYKFSTWFYTLAHRLFINQVRKKTRIVSGSEQHLNDSVYTLASDEISIETEVDRKLIKEQINQIVDTLDPDKKNTFILKYQEDLPVTEISKIMDCPVGTVKSRLHYTIKHISRNVKEYKEV